jgi:hypothetical protein
MYILKIKQEGQDHYLTGYPESIMLTTEINEASKFSEKNLKIAKFRNRMLFEMRGLEIVKISAL